MLGHKTNLNNFNRLEIISSIFSNHNSITLEINYRNKNKKCKHRETKNMLLKNQCFNEEIKEEIRKYLETNENGNTTFQTLWGATEGVLTGKFIVI